MIEKKAKTVARKTMMVMLMLMLSNVSLVEVLMMEDSYGCEKGGGGMEAVEWA